MIAGKSGIRELLKKALGLGASDLHLVADVPPAVRVNGEIQFLDEEVLDAERCKAMIDELFNDEQRQALQKDLMVGFSFEDPGLAHYRVSVYFSRGKMEAAIRIRGMEIPPFEALGLPSVVEEVTRRPQGLILITGATGDGKTTTLTAMVDVINRERRAKIIMVEDPIEYVHRNKRSIVVQQELRQDVHSFAAALRQILRLDPDIICVGEMRDPETIATALTAAETGHLVIATLHTQDSSQTVDRILDAFPGSQQAQIRAQLSNSIQAIISQKLLPRLDKKGQAMACEILLSNDAVKNSIREGKTSSIYNVVQSGRNAGMQTMDHSLKELYQKGIISYDTAVTHSKLPKNLIENLPLEK